MKTSSIQAYFELSKLVECLNSNIEDYRSNFVHLHIYFERIKSRMFSSQCAAEWAEIHSLVSREGPVRDKSGEIMMGGIKNSIRMMSEQDCRTVINKIVLLRNKVATEIRLLR